MLGVDDEEDLDFNDNNLSSSPVHGPSTPHPSPPPCVFEGDYFGMDYTAEDFSWLESSLDDKDYVNKDGYAAEEDDDDDADDDEEGDVDVDGDGDGEEGHNYFHLLAQASLSPAESSLDDSHSPEPQVPHSDDIHGRILSKEECERIEAQVWDCSHVIHYTEGHAGACMDGNELSAYENTQNELDSHVPGNAWAPFQSRIDWEVARWAKLRGCGSTAVTDLLKIPGVKLFLPYLLALYSSS